MPDISNILSTFSTASSLILCSAPRAATAARGVREVAKPPSDTPNNIVKIDYIYEKGKYKYEFISEI